MMTLDEIREKLRASRERVSNGEGWQATMLILDVLDSFFADPANPPEPIRLKPADPPLPSGPMVVKLDAKSKGELYGRIALVTGRVPGNVERDFYSLFDAARRAVQDGRMVDLATLAEAALRLGGVIK